MRNTLGFGLVWPLRRLASSDFVAAEGEALIRTCISQILGTRPGELPWRPSFGVDLERFRNKGNRAGLGEAISSTIATALQEWEPRIRVSRCTAQSEAADPSLPYTMNKITVRIDWAVVSGATPEANNVLIGPVSQEVTL